MAKSHKKERSKVNPETCQHCYCGRCWINGVEHKVCCNCGHRMAIQTVPIIYYQWAYSTYYPYWQVPTRSTLTAFR